MTEKKQKEQCKNAVENAANHKEGGLQGATLSQEIECKSKDVIYDTIQQLTATKDKTLAMDIFERGVAAIPRNHDEEHNMNLALQVLSEANPKDATESRLSLQANALYTQGMQYLSRAESQNMMCHAELYMKFAIKLLRLHNETVDALGKYRRQGEQRFIVQHINVNDGGQAAFMSGNFKAEERGGHQKNLGGTT